MASNTSTGGPSRSRYGGGTKSALATGYGLSGHQFRARLSPVIDLTSRKPQPNQSFSGRPSGINPVWDHRSAAMCLAL